MREIEIKAHLRDREGVKERLEELGCVFGEVAIQKDVVYVEKVGSIETYLSNINFLRIRETDTQCIFTVKQHKNRTQNSDSTSMPLEHEVVVNSPTELEAILRLLGYEKVLRINKTRQSTHFNTWEVCIDDVEDLGSFIEIEQLAEDDEDVAPISSQLSTFLASLGIAPKDIGVKRYDIQILEKDKKES